MTFDDWWEKPTDGWYLGRMATDDEKRYAQVAWDEATKAEREACAKVCEAMIDPVSDEWRNKRPDEAAEFDASDAGKQACADAIRMRSNV